MVGRLHTHKLSGRTSWGRAGSLRDPRLARPFVYRLVSWQGEDPLWSAFSSKDGQIPLGLFLQQWQHVHYDQRSSLPCGDLTQARPICQDRRAQRLLILKETSQALCPLFHRQTPQTIDSVTTRVLECDTSTYCWGNDGQEVCLTFCGFNLCFPAVSKVEMRSFFQSINCRVSVHLADQ